MQSTNRKILTACICAATILCAAALHAQTELPWEIGSFTRPAEGNPVIAPQPQSTFTDPILKSPVHWEALHAFNPAAIVRDGKVYVLYRAEDDTGAMQIGGHTSRLGLAVSDDGIHFKRRGEPVFFPADDLQKAREWPGGVEDPRIVESEDGTYVLTYTQWNRQTFSVGIATSTDLLHWTKQGPAFLHEPGGKYDALKYKSAGIVTRLDPAKGRLIAAQIDDKYWMYWGEGAIHLATSPDLIHWTPLEDASGAPAEQLGLAPNTSTAHFPRPGRRRFSPATESLSSTTAKTPKAKPAMDRSAPMPTLPARLCLKPTIHFAWSRGPSIPSSSLRWPTKRLANMQLEPRLPRAWSCFTASGFSITAVRIRWWAS